MNENLKTGIYLSVALLVLLVAWAVWPRADVLKESDIVGEQIFPDYENPAVASSMSIVMPDVETGRFEEFSIARRSGLWVVPSHGDYPVDSPERLQEAALALTDLEVIAIASERAEEHEMYGVVEPDSSGLSPAVAGMGTKVTLSDGQSSPLAELIIGHAVKGSQENRFVRVPGRDAVYVVAVPIEPFATRFQDWINSDLLQVSAEQFDKFVMNDYMAYAEENAISLLQHFQLAAVAAPSPPPMPQQMPPPREWRVEQFLEAEDGHYVESELLPGEMLNTQTIDTMLQTAAQLQIVDVVRKPAAMAEQLRESEFFTDVSVVPELQRFGFLPHQISREDPRLRYFASNGELRLETETGIVYKLFFGRLLSGEEGSSAGDLRRYMMVIADLNPAKIPPLNLLPEPTPPEPSAAPESAEESTDTADTTEETAEETAEGETAEESTPATDADDDVFEGPPEGVSEAAWEQYMQTLLFIRQHNQSEREALVERTRDAKERVTELNDHFADWFYVISEAEFDRLHLSRTELFTAGEGGVGLQEFNELRRQGLQRDTEIAVPQAPRVP